jgi:lysophospholipase L1-like esterase
MLIQPNSKLVMIGDSITDVERARPVGEGLFGALGKGYVAVTDAMLSSTYPERRIRVVNMGLGGNTVRDLKARWNNDVLALKPDWVSVMIGINDVWRQFDSPLRPEIAVPLAEYSDTLDELVEKTIPAVKGMVLMTPYMIEPNKKDAMRKTMDAYGSAVKKIAKKHKTIVVDAQAAFDSVLKHTHPMNLAWDRIHPGITGHTLIARAFLRAVGYEWK